MGWPYQFVDLTGAQKHQRRTLLDTYGLIAQASAGVVLLAIQFVFLFQWIHRKRNESNSPDVPSSPHIKHSHKNQSGHRSIGYWWRRFSWWAGEPCTIFNNHLGTQGQVTTATIWTFWLLGLCFAETGKDYLHLTKRFGIVGASQLPFHYLLIWKSSWSPVQVLTRASHETLNAYHQLLGRVATYLVILHAAFYLNFYVQNNLLSSKLKEAYVLCGIVAVVAFVAIGTTALGPVRKWSYRVFYAIHVALATALLPVLFFHVSHIRIYLYETFAVYVLNVTVRWVLSRELRGSVRSVPNTSLVEITIPMDSSKASRQLAEISAPGQHAYVSLGRKSLLRVFRSNPFTVASIPGVDKTIKFVARVADGNTRRLLASAERASADTKTQLTLEGPYGLNTHEDHLMQYDRVLFVAGGVGATFIVPLYRQLLADLSPSKGSYRRQKISCVWIARSKAEVTWAIPKDQREKDGFTERLKICLTGLGAAGSEVAFDQEDNGDVAVGETEDAIELEEQKQLLSGNDIAPTGRSDLPLHTGRPDLRRLVEQTFSHGSQEKIAIIVCGPNSLSQSLRREVTPWVKRGREVWFHDEGFSL